ncbi:MAG: hypothetical protein GY799_04685, partial [Desulfobulbaceae bacterium]|nr:hypothetical protein [Desulfobulbaceae bacterium]
DIADRIFDPFFTTKPRGEGTGIGVDIAKKIIDKHNGKTVFESIAEKGIKFTIVLPL